MSAGRVVVLLTTAAGLASLATLTLGLGELEERQAEIERSHAIEISALYFELEQLRHQTRQVLTPREFSPAPSEDLEYLGAELRVGGLQVLWEGSSLLVVDPTGPWVLLERPAEDSVQSMVLGTDGAPPPAAGPAWILQDADPGLQGLARIVPA